MECNGTGEEFVDVHDNDVHDDDEDDDDEDDGDDNIHLMTIKTHDMAIGRISLDTRLISFLMVATDGLNMISSLIFFFKYLKLAKGPPSKSKEVPTTHILDQDLMFPKSIKYKITSDWGSSNEQGCL